MKKNRYFSKVLKIYFWIGVNVIGIPVFHNHELAIYKYTSK